MKNLMCYEIAAGTLEGFSSCLTVASRTLDNGALVIGPTDTSPVASMVDCQIRAFICDGIGNRSSRVE